MIRVLIADDHGVIRAGVRTILASRGDIEVHEACDGAEAIGKALELAPDMVILDLTMPVIGGYAAAVELRRLAPEIPVLFFSMHDSPQLMKDAKRIGVRGFLNKRDACHALLDAVDELVLARGEFFPVSVEPEIIPARLLVPVPTKA